MSPRAACRLETLVFVDVYDYVAGKVDWLAHNLPTEGAGASAPTAGSRLRHDAPTAGPDETLAAVRVWVDGFPVPVRPRSRRRSHPARPGSGTPPSPAAPAPQPKT